METRTPSCDVARLPTRVDDVDSDDEIRRRVDFTDLDLGDRRLLGREIAAHGRSASTRASVWSAPRRG